VARQLAQLQPAFAAEALEVELARIGAMNIDQLRAAWREVFASDPPLACSKDLLARAIAFHAQQTALGGLPPVTARLLRSLISPGYYSAGQVRWRGMSVWGRVDRPCVFARGTRMVYLSRTELAKAIANIPRESASRSSPITNSAL
jgi:hypothetical protein